LKEVTFKSNDAAKPAKFYINSAPAYKPYVTQLITTDAKLQKANPKQYALAISDHYGKMEDSNDRIVNQLIVKDVLERVKNGGTNQLQMGLTELAPGSVWNTMPAHTHTRRMEAYFYFEVPDEHAVCHFMGEVDETRHIWMKGDQAVLSPEWSIHSAAATHNYTFIWGMGGENLDYGDQDFSLITDLKSGQVDAVIFEEPVAKGFVENNPDLAIAELNFEKEQDDSYAVAMKKDSKELKEAVDKTIQKLKESGELDKLIEDAFKASIEK